MDTYKVTLSTSEVKGIGVSRWAATKGKKYAWFGFGSLVWMAGIIFTLLSFAPSVFVHAICAPIAVVPILVFYHRYSKETKQAAFNHSSNHFGSAT